jgi:hypothetical protein
MGFFSKIAATDIKDAHLAVANIHQQFDVADLKVVLLFVSNGYNLKQLAEALRNSFNVPVIGCTTAGNIGANGYQLEGIQAIAIGGSSVTVHSELIQPLDQCQLQVSTMAQRLNASPLLDGFHRFGLLLVDGLSLMEERLAATVYYCFPDIPLVGGSAGDDLSFETTFIYTDGRFLSNAAVLAIIETDVPFTAFKFQHFVPTEEFMVVTEADTESRTVCEINGEPAAQAYARILGLKIDELSPNVFSRSPLMLKAGPEYYVRSIQQCNEDLSLTFYCAIAKGIVLWLGETVSPLKAVTEALAQVREVIPEPSLIIGCDCILRRLEFEQSGLMQPIGDLLALNHVSGFSTYGEQFNALHMNQTFTGLAIGGANE